MTYPGATATRAGVPVSGNRHRRRVRIGPLSIYAERMGVFRTSITGGFGWRGRHRVTVTWWSR